jgi:RNA polymerase sigma-70 factor (ECF subfamily)
MNGARNEAERLYDRLLVVRCQTGDRQAFEELVERFGPRLRYFLRKMAPRGDRAEDLLQETWADVFRQLPRLQDAGAFTAWAYRIARGKANLDHRRNERRPLMSRDVELVAAADSEPRFSPEDAARVHAALDELPPEQREALVLRFLEGLSYEEISQVVGCPAGTVRSRIHYGKQALQRLLGPPEDEASHFNRRETTKR